MATPLDPRVSAKARAIVRSRAWLTANGYGGAYSGTALEVETAMDNFYPGGFKAFEASADANERYRIITHHPYNQFSRAASHDILEGLLWSDVVAHLKRSQGGDAVACGDFLSRGLRYAFTDKRGNMAQVERYEK